MKKTLSIVFASATVIVIACGGSSPVDLCNDSAATACNKIYTCLTGAALDAAKTIYGATEADCTTKFKTTADCANAGEKQCQAPTKYDSSAASKCVSDYKAMSCADISAGKTPDACKQVCK